MNAFDCIVAGAGVVGLAIARALAQAGHSVLIAEAGERHGLGVSSRNSEVIHAGLYYPAGSLKARLCVRGRHLLYEYCARRSLPHCRIGKWIVATDAEQEGDLAGIAAAAAANGVDDLRPLSRDEIRIGEPALRAVGALVSPSTGIFDAQSYMLSLLGEAEDAGAVLATRSAVTTSTPLADGGQRVWFAAQAEPLDCRWLINATGLAAPALAARIDGLPDAARPTAWYAKGHYFSVAGRVPFSRLIYPVPEPGGLGVHLTLDLGGQARFGPDVQWVDTPSYDVPPARGARYYAVIRRYWPALPDGALQAAYAGVRPKLSGPGAPSADFRIDGPAQHGLPGVINLFGIESPGLTASLALAEDVLAMVAEAA